jgi:hypothetical protein
MEGDAGATTYVAIAVRDLLTTDNDLFPCSWNFSFNVIR